MKIIIFQREDITLFNRIYRFNGYDCKHTKDGERYVEVSVNKIHKGKN